MAQTFLSCGRAVMSSFIRVASTRPSSRGSRLRARLGWARRDYQISGRRIASRSGRDDLNARFLYGDSVRALFSLAAAREVNSVLFGSAPDWLVAPLYLQRAQLWQSVSAAERCR